MVKMKLFVGGVFRVLFSAAAVLVISCLSAEDRVDIMMLSFS